MLLCYYGVIVRENYKIVILTIECVSRKQNKFQIRKKAGIQSQENGHIYKIKTWSMHLVKLFDFEGVKDKPVLPNLQPRQCNFASQFRSH